MRIGGLQKTSVIDYPGRLCCVVFTVGCNFRCPYCHNPELVSKSAPPLMDEKEFFSFLSVRKGFLDGVSITGGEPCLWQDLPDFCSRLKADGFCVKLDTNGSMPDMLFDLVKKRLVDYIAMDVKTDPARYTELAGPKVSSEEIVRSIDIIRGSGLDYEFRTTCARPFVDLKTVEIITDMIAGAPLYALQKFRPDRVLAPEFFKDIPQFDADELQKFKAVAEKKVGSCIIR
ncbi:MAG: anaerobic ribonucleoside-triphosphate reductase activating protein [Desulfococcus sp. 4484_241]|nr:MAG: anaerobic ribonucleoside-triphosphate reductase activating protein [Desulfococcus sp. 4484_241]